MFYLEIRFPLTPAITKRSSKMKNIFCFLLYAVFVVADPMEVNSSSLESKIKEGEIFEDIEEFLCVASLQINRTHYCSAGMFKPGFLITTGACVSGIELERSNADVVLGHKDLNKGERYEIVNLTKDPNYRTSRRLSNPRDYDVGVIMIEVDKNRKNLSTLPLGRKRTHLTIDGNLATLCKWSAATESGLNPNILKCINVWLQSTEKCRLLLLEMDFRQKHYCGNEETAQTVDPADYGSPLIMAYNGNDNYKLYIIGIASRTFELGGRFYTHFLRSSFIFPNVQIMVQQLERGESSAPSLPYVPYSKRRRLKIEQAKQNNKEKKQENNEEEKRRKGKQDKELKIG